MELWAVIISGIAAAGGIGGAFVAVAQAKYARDARNDARASAAESARLAGVATDAFVRQAEAQERANELEEAKRRPPTWTRQFVSGDTWALVNTSGQRVVIVSLDVDPDEATRYLGVPTLPARLYEQGQSWRYLLGKLGQLHINRLIIHWRFESEPEDTIHDTVVPI